LSADDEARRLLAKLGSWRGRDLVFMEVCGTHTMAAARAGLRQLLPPSIRLVSGPGCPVCVTPVGYVDHAVALSELRGVTVATFGDLLRVPGSARGPGRATPRSLATARAAGADVRVVYSPLDALALARAHPEREVVFLGVGFETTAPTLGAAVLQAQASNLGNFAMLLAAKTIPNALEVLASSPELRLDGLLCPGHVSVVLGTEVYRPLAQRFHLPCAIAGFEPVEMLRGLEALVDQASAAEAKVVNCYPGAVRPEGNVKARAVIERAFRPVDSVWRGLGPIALSGLGLRDELGAHDAARRFEVVLPEAIEPVGCRCGDVLRGVLDPVDCPLFGTACTPEQPQGACMVSSEGSCAARYQYRLEGR
jgi:hydrogenase expression/formation protein HypD